MIFNTISKDLAKTRQNLNYIGADPIHRYQDDIIENWVSLGTGVMKLNLFDTGLHRYWECSEGGSFPNEAMLINCVSGSMIYQILFDGEKILTRRGSKSSGLDYVWTSYAHHDELPRYVDQWESVTNGTNISDNAYVLYNEYDGDVHVRIENCTTKVKMTASDFSNKKLIATGLPVPKSRQFGVGLVGNSVAYFYVEPIDSENPGYLRFFGIPNEIAVGTKIELAYSYFMDNSEIEE